MNGITINRDLLLLAVDRHCFFSDCQARISIGLTKGEAQHYRGFECTLCKRWNDDVLTERDVPEWWNVLNESC